MLLEDLRNMANVNGNSSNSNRPYFVLMGMAGILFLLTVVYAVVVVESSEVSHFKAPGKVVVNLQKEEYLIFPVGWKLGNVRLPYGLVIRVFDADTGEQLPVDPYGPGSYVDAANYTGMKFRAHRAGSYTIEASGINVQVELVVARSPATAFMICWIVSLVAIVGGTVAFLFYWKARGKRNKLKKNEKDEAFFEER